MTPEPAAPEQGQLAHAASCAHFGMTPRQAAAAWPKRDARDHAYFAAIEQGVIDAAQPQPAPAQAQDQPLSDYLRERGRPGVASAIERAEAAARQPQPAPGERPRFNWPQFTAAVTALRQIAGAGTLEDARELADEALEAVEDAGQPAPELAALRLAVIAEVREAASCNSDDEDECARCCRHADRIIAAVRGAS